MWKNLSKFTVFNSGWEMKLDRTHSAHFWGSFTFCITQ